MSSRDGTSPALPGRGLHQTSPALPDERGADAEAVPAPVSSRREGPPTRFPLPPRLAFAGAFLTGILYWLAFPGKLPLGAWHGALSLFAFIPLWLALQGQPPKRATWIGVVAGATMNVAGFTWLLDMLDVFSGFPLPLCIFFMLLVCTYQGGRLGLMGWLYSRASARGWPAALVFVAAFAASELVYPLLFPWYFAATTYQLPALSQTAELGGPILVGSILVGVNIALAEPLLARLEGRAPLRLRLAVPLGVLALALAFAAVRIPAVDQQAQAGEPLHVGVVQGNLGLIQKREDPAEGLRRHLDLTTELKAKGVELVVWSESSVTMLFPERGYGNLMKELFTRSIGMPAIFGAVLYSEGGLQQALYNTALSVDARGEVTGRYDKEYLLAFGEYLPFGEMFPKIYEWSPNSGHFTPGTVVDPLPVTINGMTHPVSVLVCYEDILPGFTHRVVAHSRPELLANMSNDAWFGDTSEPWEHLALAQMRAIEHRRYLVRSTNSGVSAIVDPVGRVMVHGGTFDSEALDAIVHWLHDPTVYDSVGDVPWMLASALVFAAAFVARGKRSVALGGVGGAGAMVALLVATFACSSTSTSTRTDASDVARPRDDVVEAASPVDVGVVDAGPCPSIATVDFEGPSCDSCVATSCCMAATACYGPLGGVRECGLYANCVAECDGADGDAGGPDAQTGCIADCASGYGSGLGAYGTLTSCIDTACKNDAGTGPCN